MTEKCKIKPTLHVQGKMDIYDIGMDLVLECILKGAKRVEKDSMRGDKIVSNCKGFEVTFKKYPCSFYTISVTWLTEEKR
jgi:hypothetical protein